jgi:hypothetical protein
MLRRVGLAALALVAIAAVGWGIWLVRPHAELKDWIALAAVVISLSAWLQARRSANAATKNAALAQRNEERSRYGWSVVLHPNGDRYVLRNTGTLDAHDVRFANQADFAAISFYHHDGESGPVIASGEARAFTVQNSFGSVSAEVVMDWRPDGETVRRTFTEVLPPAPDLMAEFKAERKQRRASEEAAYRQDLAEVRRLLLELAVAWSSYVADTSNIAAKLRVQAIVAVLPGNYAREIGYAVDVPRDFWGIGQWPLENLVSDEDAKRLVAKDAPMIELLWNMADVQIDPIGRDGDSASWERTYRIEEAVPAYVEMVRRREQGDRELRDGPNDLRHKQEARRMIAETRERLEASHKDYGPSQSFGQNG